MHDKLEDRGRAPFLVMTSGVAIFDGSGAVLLVRQAYGEQMFCTPGGVVEPGEDPHAAAMREAQEEIGVLPSIVALGGATLNVHADGPRMDFLFIAELPMGAEPTIVDRREVQAIGWYDPRALPSPCWPIVDLLPHLADGARGVILDQRH